MLKKIITVKTFQYGLAALLALSIGIYFRLYPLLNFSPNEAHEKATLLVLAQVRAQIQNSLEQANPNISQDNKEQLIQKALNEVIHKESKRIRETIAEVSQKITDGIGSAQTEPYLLASDSYYYLNLTQNIVNTGTIAEETKGSKFFNAFTLAPEGHWEPITWHPYIGFFVYKIVQIFKPETSLVFGVSFTSLFTTALCLVAFTVLCFQMRVGPLQSFVAGVYFLLIPVFVKRSTFAWYDNDAYSIFFPLVITGLYFGALKRLENKKSLLILGTLSAFTFTLYALFWQGWVFLFSVLLASGFLVLTANQFIFKVKEKNKNFILMGASFLLTSIIFISTAFGLSEFFILFKEGFTAANNFLTPQLSAWPDLYISVGELFKINLGQLIELIGGPVIIIISLSGILLSLIQRQDDEGLATNLKAIVLLVYFALSLYFAMGAQRFIILFVVPLSLGFALGLKKLYALCIKSAELLGGRIKMARPVIANIVAFIFILLIFIPVTNIHNQIQSLLNPIYNESWDRALTRIKNETPPQSIINTWWTPGHFIKAMAHRRVTFDGGTINVPQAYWMAYAYMAPSETEALGILRMLNNSANQTSDYLQQLNYPVSESVEIIKKITPVDRFNAKMILTTKLKDPKHVKDILTMTHATPPPSYILIFNELVEKNIQFGLFGKWNFEAIERINQTPSLLAKVPDRDSQEYIDFLWQLAGGAYKFSEKLAQVKRIDKIAVFDHGLSLNMETKDCQINSPRFGRGIPFSIWYEHQGQVVEKLQGNPTLNYSVVLLTKDNQYEAILMDRPLAQSLLIRLYYFNGTGLKYIKPFDTTSDLTERTVIKTFSVDWAQFQKDFGN